MSAEVDWVLAQLQSVVDDQPADHPLTRVNRDDSELLEGNIRTRTAELQESNYVGAALASVDATPIGTEFDQNVERIVGVRVEGLYCGDSTYGHANGDGVDFDDLVAAIQSALQAKREFPNVDRASTTYRSLYIENHAPQSAQHRDYYRYDFDVRFSGHETLP